MERAVALKKLTKLVGKGFGYRFDPKAPLKDAREAAREELKAANASRRKLVEQREARREALLKADAEYQKLDAECKVAAERAEKLLGISGWYRVTVGASNGMFFTVKAQGDSWEAVIAKLEKEAGVRV